ncbi:MAG: cell division protein FtsZ [Patescibacteria group bacterium]|nr:cell division protein FtsZ [Patescibacteria group bacterium]MDE2015383.1 cell division protein FtsZ [Patescibacteria group bacterium]MDE2227002.1 cell division protein FtsZ [Patescibacteria group bacterium]
MKKIKKSKQKNQGKQAQFANIKVIGVGGGGGNAVSRMSRDFLRGVDFIAINTDHQDLDVCGVRQKIYIGRNLTRGLGTGMNPDLGRQAAEENRSEIAESLHGADMVFIAAGLGGGTGTGGAPIVAEAAKQAGALTIAVVTKPFAFEGSQRDRIAREGLIKLKEKVDALIVVPNDRIFTIIHKDTPILKAFEAIDDVLKNSLRGIVELIASPGIINLDFADVKNVVQDAGIAVIGVGTASGADRATSAVNLALNSPLLETSAEGAKAVILGISGGRDLKMSEINDAAKVVAQVADPGARIIFGAYHDRSLKPNQIKVTMIATGFNGNQPNSLFSGHLSESKAQGVFPRTLKSEDDGREEKMSPTPFDSKHSSAAAKVKSSDGGSLGREVVREEKRFEKGDISKKESDIWDIPTFLRRKKK